MLIWKTPQNGLFDVEDVGFAALVGRRIRRFMSMFIPFETLALQYYTLQVQGG